MAALRRAFVALGSMRLDALGEETVADLQRLRELYFRKKLDDEQEQHREGEDQTAKPSPQSPFQGRRVSGKRHRAQDEDRHDEDDNDDSHLHGGRQSTKKRKQQVLPTRRPERLRTRRDGTCNQGCGPSRWALGPDSSSEDAVRRYRHLFLGSDDTTGK